MVRPDVAAVGVDVGEDRSRPQEHGRSRRSDESARRRHHLVARPDSEDPKRQLQRERAVGERDAMLSAEGAGERILKGEDLAAGPLIDSSGSKDLRDGLDFVLAEKGPRLLGGGPQVSAEAGASAISFTFSILIPNLSGRAAPRSGAPIALYFQLARIR